MPSGTLSAWSANALRGSANEDRSAVFPRLNAAGSRALNYNVIGTGVAENPDAKPEIDYAQDFNLTYLKATPGKGPSLHSHDHVEVFIPMTGRWSVTWGEAGEHEVILERSM